MEENILNTKNELFLTQNSVQLFYFKQLPNYAQLLYFKEWFRNQAPLQFFTVTDNDFGIYFWEYEKESEEYKSKQMIASAQSGNHRRGGINEEGIYVVAGLDSKNVKIYDMKYYNYPDHKIKLLQSFSHSDYVYECFFKNSTSAICCDWDGYIKEYNLSNPHSIPTPTTFNKTTALSELVSCMETKDKKYIIAGDKDKLYILDAEDGTLTNTLNYDAYGGYPEQIAVRPNILVTVDGYTKSLHDIRDIHNIPKSIKLLDFGKYYRSVIALESNSGDFAIGGEAKSIPFLGFVYIYHLEDNQTINTLKYVDNIQGEDCSIAIIKELKRGTIIFGGSSNCEEMCLWNYAAIPDQDPLCWDVQIGNFIMDIVGVPY